MKFTLLVMLGIMLLLVGLAKAQDAAAPAATPLAAQPTADEKVQILLKQIEVFQQFVLVKDQQIAQWKGRAEGAEAKLAELNATQKLAALNNQLIKLMQEDVPKAHDLANKVVDGNLEFSDKK